MNPLTLILLRRLHCIISFRPFQQVSFHDATFLMKEEVCKMLSSGCCNHFTFYPKWSPLVTSTAAQLNQSFVNCWVNIYNTFIFMSSYVSIKNNSVDLIMGSLKKVFVEQTYLLHWKIMIIDLLGISIFIMFLVFWLIFVLYS